MPIYEYECGACGRRFEELQDMNAPKTSACPKCKGNSNRLLSAATPISSQHGCSGPAHCGIKDGAGMPQCSSGGCVSGKCHGF